MSDYTEPLVPVAPSGMDIRFFYVCPTCEEQLKLVSPTRPAIAICPFCNQKFPILPVDERGVQYVQLMMGNGLSAADLDFY